MTQTEFDILYLLKKQPGLTQREISENLSLSLGNINKNLKTLKDSGFVNSENKLLKKGEKAGEKLLEKTKSGA